MERTRLKIAVLTTPSGSFVTHYLVKHLDVRGIVVDTGTWGPKQAKRTTVDKVRHYLARGGVRGVARAVLRKGLRVPADAYSAGAQLEQRYLEALDRLYVGYPLLARRMDLREFAPLDAVAKFYDVPLVQVTNVNEPAAAAALRSFDVDLAIIVGGRIVKPSVISIPRLGMLNKHSAILPKHRGLAAEYWCLYHEDFESLGVSVHYVDPGLDTGNVVVQKKLSFVKGDNPATLRFKSELLGREAIVEAVELIERTGTKGVPQDESRATKNRAPTPETDRELYAKLPRLWEKYGAEP